MDTRTVDVAIIGAGTAGLTARRAVEKLGKTAVLIDPGPYGTTCARVGCMPSKLLIAAAEAAHHVRDAETFGVVADLQRIDGVAVMARVRRERDRFAGFVVDGVEELKERDLLIPGRATFLSPTRLRVDDRLEVVFERAIIATGSSAFVPPPYRALGDRLVFNDDVFDWEDLPRSVLVVGSGVIGLELGQALHRLGVDVTVIGIDGVVGPLSDGEIKESAEALFAAEFPFLNRFTLDSVTRTEGGLHIVGEDARRGPLDRDFDLCLMAAGRRPNLSGLNIEALGTCLGPRGKCTDLDPHTLQVGEHPVFLAGDVANLRPLLHEAADEGKIAGRNAVRYPHVIRELRRAPIAVVFTDPQIALVGKKWADLTPGTFATGEVDLSRQGRARVMNVNKGKLRIYGDLERGRVVGAEMAGPRMEHVAHLVAWAIQQGLTCEDLLEMPFYHPCIEEGLRTALQSLQRSLRMGRPRGRAAEEVGPGA